MNCEYWYALFVKSGDEENVKERLIYKIKEDYQFLIPKRKMRERKDGRWRERVRILFPGYIFVQGNITPESNENFSDVPGLYKLLRNDMLPLRIVENEVRILKQLMNEGETIRSSSIILEDNNKIKVIEGPLVDLEGYIEKINRRKGRAKVRLNIFGEPRVVELSINILNSVMN